MQYCNWHFAYRGRWWWVWNKGIVMSSGQLDIHGETCWSTTWQTTNLNMRLPGITPSPCGEKPASTRRYDTASVCTYIHYNIPKVIKVTTAFSPVFPPLLPLSQQMHSIPTIKHFHSSLTKITIVFLSDLFTPFNHILPMCFFIFTSTHQLFKIQIMFFCPVRFNRSRNFYQCSIVRSKSRTETRLCDLLAILNVLTHSSNFYFLY